MRINTIIFKISFRTLTFYKKEHILEASIFSNSFQIMNYLLFGSLLFGTTNSIRENLIVHLIKILLNVFKL